MRRVIYLTSRNKSEMLSKVFTTQWNNPVKNDWTLEVKRDLKDFCIGDHLEVIRGYSKSKFKRLTKVRYQ